MTAFTVLKTFPHPVYEIDLSQIKAPAEISTIFKREHIEKYVYSFVFVDQVIKYGISGDSKSIPGERVYRQAGHLEGWKTQLAIGSSGCDMRDINERYFSKTGKRLNRIGMKVVVHDLSSVDSPSPVDRQLPIKQLERELIKEYEEKYKDLPVGNVKDESYIDRKTFVTKDTFNRLFEFE
jgi:hypothetical protein